MSYNYNLVEFSSGYFDGQPVTRPLLIGLVLDPVIPYRVKPKSGEVTHKWVICIPLVQSETSNGFLELWADDKRELPALLCRGQIIIVDKFKPSKRYEYDYDGFINKDGALMSDPNSFISMTKRYATVFYPHAAVVDYLDGLDEFYKSSILQESISIDKGIDTHTTLLSLKEAYTMYKARKENYINLRPCLLTNMYMWKEMCVLELFDDSFNADDSPTLNGLNLGKMAHDSAIAHHNPKAPVFHVCVPLLFSSLYFTIPKFQCGNLVILRNVLSYCSRGDRHFSYLFAADKISRAGYQGAQQLPNSHPLAKMQSLLVPGSVGILTALVGRKLWKNGYHDIGIVSLAGSALIGYFCFYDYRRRSAKDYKTNLVKERRGAYDVSQDREITRFLEEHYRQNGTLNLLKHPMMGQQVLMRVIQEGEQRLQSGDRLGAIAKFSIAAALSYISGGDDKGRKLVKTICDMLPDITAAMVKSYEEDIRAVNKFLEKISGPPTPAITREQFIQKLKKVDSHKLVVEEVLDEDSIDEDSIDEGLLVEGDDNRTSGMVIEEIEDEEVIVVTEPVVVQAEKSELENEPQVKDEGSISSQTYSTPEVLSGSDFKQPEVTPTEVTDTEILKDDEIVVDCPVDEKVIDQLPEVAVLPQSDETSGTPEVDEIETVAEPVEELKTKTVDEPVEDFETEPVDEPVEEVETLDEPVEEFEIESVDEPVEELKTETVDERVEEVDTDSVDEPVDEPVDQSETESLDEPVEEFESETSSNTSSSEVVHEQSQTTIADVHDPPVIKKISITAVASEHDQISAVEETISVKPSEVDVIVSEEVIVMETEVDQNEAGDAPELSVNNTTTPHDTMKNALEQKEPLDTSNQSQMDDEDLE